MSEEKKPYRKDGSEYIFEMRDESGNTITARAKIANGAPSEAMIGTDTLALFPERSSNHRRIIALLEAEKEKARALGPKG